MENSGRPYRTKPSGWERGGAPDKEEAWRIPDQGRGQNFRPEGGQQGKKNQGGPFRASPRKGPLGPLSYSPGGFRGGHSPSQKEDARWYPGSENSGGLRDDGWRERSQQQQHWRRSGQAEGSKEDREQGRREDSDGGANKLGKDLNNRFFTNGHFFKWVTHPTIHHYWFIAQQKHNLVHLTHVFLPSEGKRRRNRNKKKSFGEENRSHVNEDAALSTQELQSLRQAESRLLKDGIYCLKKVQSGVNLLW